MGGNEVGIQIEAEGSALERTNGVRVGASDPGGHDVPFVGLRDGSRKESACNTAIPGAALDNKLADPDTAAVQRLVREEDKGSVSK